MKSNISRRVLMVRAWQMVKLDGMSMSDAMKAAWVEQKANVYSWEMTDARRSAISATISDIKGQDVQDIHDAHKVAILSAALMMDVVNGYATMYGKMVGLCKWACKRQGL